MGSWGGTNARFATPDSWKAGSQTSLRETPSGFVKMSVRTSLGLSVRNVLTVFR